MAIPIFTASPVIAQFAKGWPSDDSSWSFGRGIIPTRAREGAGQITGEAEFYQRYGLVKQPGDKLVRAWGPAPDYGRSGITDTLTDQYIRLLLGNDGPIIVNNRGYTPFWWGVVGPRRLKPDGNPITAGGIASWSATGIISVLNTIFITRGYEMAADGATIVDPGFCPAFNDLPFGDASADPFTVNGQSVYIFDRGGASDRFGWQAADIINLLLAGYANPNILGDDTPLGGLTWQLNDPDDLLAFNIRRMEVRGRSVLEVINSIINPRRGLIYRTTVSGNVASINVYSVAQTAITIGAVTIPAATPTDLDIAGDGTLTEPNFAQENVAVDYGAVTGANPLIGITLYWNALDPNSSLIPDGWAVTDDPSDNPSDQYIWRRWKINPTWNGLNYKQATSGLRSLLAADGTRTWQPNTPQAAVLELDRQTPMGDGLTAADEGPRNAPLLIIGRTGEFDDFSTQIDLTVNINPASITIGQNLSADGDDNSVTALIATDTLADGTDSLIITIGVYEWSPLHCWWTRDRADWPRDLPRTWMREIPDATQRIALAGTVFGVDDSGDLIIQPTDMIIRDELPVCQATLAAALARLSGSGGGNGSWERPGQIDITDTYAPGACFLGLVTTAQDTFEIYAPVTSRDWDFNPESVGTAYSTQRVLADIEARP